MTSNVFLEATVLKLALGLKFRKMECWNPRYVFLVMWALPSDKEIASVLIPSVHRDGVENFLDGKAF